MIEYIQVVAGSLGLGVVAGVIGVMFYYKSQGKSLVEMKRERMAAKAKTKEEIEREKREALLRLKDEVHKRRSDFELEVKKTRSEYFGASREHA